METDSDDSYKNAVFGIVVSNTGKGARGGCRRVQELLRTAPSTDSFDPLFALPFWSSMIRGESILVHRSSFNCDAALSSFKLLGSLLLTVGHASMAYDLELRSLELLRLRRCSFPGSKTCTAGNAVMLYIMGPQRFLRGARTKHNVTVWELSCPLMIRRGTVPSSITREAS